MEYHEFRFLIHQTSEGHVHEPDDSIGCALITGWTDKKQNLSEIKKNISKAFQIWFATKDSQEYVEEDDSIVNYNIVDLAEAINSSGRSVREVMNEHEINDLKIEIFNTESEWKLDDILAVVPQMSRC